NPLLRCLLAKGAKYRDPKPINWNKTNEAIAIALDKYIQYLARKYKKHLRLFEAYRQRFLTILNNRVKYLRKHVRFKETASFFSNKDLTEELSFLHSRYVIVPPDKAANNFVFICKKYYIMKHCSELGISVFPTLSITGNITYSPVNTSEIDIINNHKTASSHYKLNLSSQNSVLPSLYGLPKLHKNPVKFRFIAAASKSSLKPLSCLLHSILTCINAHLKNYCRKAAKYQGFDLYWAIDNSLFVINRINSSPNLRCTNLVEAFDFSTLFPNLPHNVIKKTLSDAIEFSFSKSGMDSIAASLFKSYYSSILPENGNYILLNKHEVKDLVHYVIDQTYVKFSGIVFRQIAGIPMGGNASPLLASLCLSFLEFQFLKNVANRNYAMQMPFVCRYIDDILVFNCPHFKNIAKLIYPSSLPLEQASTSANGYCNYLDLKITVSPIAVTIYNKVDDFDFTVSRYTHFSSNVSLQLGYGIYKTQLIRFARICTNFAQFIDKSKILTQTLVSQGYSKTALIFSATMCFTEHPNLFAKFGALSTVDKI
ncbi:MAG: hypothetical protein GY821_04340, partial [Gammaproteobacteria bacterium]|nr:hypothetical protein [Gammaproteobacteria bacterium]